MLEKWFFVLVIGGLMIGATPVMAQTYSLDWGNVEGAGGTSQGGQYVIRGTFGQPDAGTLTGGSFTLAGGFWAGDWASGHRLFLPLILKLI